MPTICVRALSKPREGCTEVPMVTHVAAHLQGTKRMVGFKHDATIGQLFDHHEDTPDGKGKTSRRMTGGFVAHAENETVDVTNPEHAKYYRDALTDGDLLPGDEATAKWAGVKFTSAPPDTTTTHKKGG